MSIIIKINNTDRSNFIIAESLNVKQEINEKRDTCKFKIRKNSTVTPTFNDDIEIYDGATQIFGGTIIKIDEGAEMIGSEGIVYSVEAFDYSFEMDKQLVSATYSNQGIDSIITDILSNNAPDFDANNVESTFNIEKIVFNQITPSRAIQKLADIVRYDWYVDENKSVHFFAKEGKRAPFNITDTSGNYVYKSLKRKVDGSQLVNIVKVRGGQYDGSSYTDEITVSGNVSKSFKLPYKFANLQVWLDTGGGYVEQDVGVDFIDDFTSKDVLHNYQEHTIRFETALSDSDKVRFTGNPKVRVFAISVDGDSKDTYGASEKLIRDESIDSNEVARKRAAAELYAYANTLNDAEFFTYNSGLRVGQTITLDSDTRGIDTTLIIRNLNFKMIDPNNFGYQVKLISTKRLEFVNILQSLLEPDPQDADETEVSESIFANPEDLIISEEHELVTPVNDHDTLMINESHLLDPVDPANIEWVYGYYFPASDSDTKRMGRYSRDATYG